MCLDTLVIVIIVLIDLLLFASSFAFGITNIVIGSKWEDCHLDKVDSYLIAIGSLGLCYAILWGGNKTDSSKKHGEQSDLQKLAGFAILGLLIWGTTIFYDSEQGNCRSSYYKYAYYYTLISMFLTVAYVSILILGFVIPICCSSLNTTTSISITLKNTTTHSGNTNNQDNSETKPTTQDSIV